MRFTKIVAIILVGALFLTACGTATPTAVDEMTEGGQRFMLSLPRLVVDIDANGQPSIGGFGIADLGRLTGLQVQEVGLHPFYVDWMTFTNVQHIELAHASNGIFLFANGEPLPHLAWDGESLGNVGSVADMLVASNVSFARLVGLLVPVIQRTGLNIVVRFPTMAGAQDIPLREAGAPMESSMEETSAAPFVTHIDIDYDERGVPSLAGITSRDAAEAGLFLPVELTPESMNVIKAYGVGDVQVISNGKGLFVSVNGMALPHIAWNDSYLANGADLYAQMNPDSPYIELVNLLVPELNNLDVDVRIRFPGAQ